MGSSVSDKTEKDEITRHDTTRPKLLYPSEIIGVLLILQELGKRKFWILSLARLPVPPLQQCDFQQLNIAI